eukprot:376138_1
MRVNFADPQGNALFESLKSLDPTADRSDYRYEGEWDMTALSEDIELTKTAKEKVGSPNKPGSITTAADSVKLATKKDSSSILQADSQILSLEQKPVPISRIADVISISKTDIIYEDDPPKSPEANAQPTNGTADQTPPKTETAPEPDSTGDTQPVLDSQPVSDSTTDAPPESFKSVETDSILETHPEISHKQPDMSPSHQNSDAMSSIYDISVENQPSRSVSIETKAQLDDTTMAVQTLGGMAESKPEENKAGSVEHKGGPWEASIMEDDVHCVCQRPEEGFMINCDNCSLWYHAACVGVEQSEAENWDEYYCFRCEGNESPSEGQGISKHKSRSDIKKDRAERHKHRESVFGKVAEERERQALEMVVTAPQTKEKRSRKRRRSDKPPSPTGANSRPPSSQSNSSHAENKSQKPKSDKGVKDTITSKYDLQIHQATELYKSEVAQMQQWIQQQTQMQLRGQNPTPQQYQQVQQYQQMQMGNLAKIHEHRIQKIRGDYYNELGTLGKAGANPNVLLEAGIRKAAELLRRISRDKATKQAAQNSTEESKQDATQQSDAKQSTTTASEQSAAQIASAAAQQSAIIAAAQKLAASQATAPPPTTPQAALQAFQQQSAILAAQQQLTAANQSTAQQPTSQLSAASQAIIQQQMAAAASQSITQQQLTKAYQSVVQQKQIEAQQTAARQQLAVSQQQQPGIQQQLAQSVGSILPAAVGDLAAVVPPGSAVLQGTAAEVGQPPQNKANNNTSTVTEDTSKLVQQRMDAIRLTYSHVIDIANRVSKLPDEVRGKQNVQQVIALLEHYSQFLQGLFRMQLVGTASQIATAVQRDLGQVMYIQQIVNMWEEQIGPMLKEFCGDQGARAQKVDAGPASQVNGVVQL